MDLGKLLNIVRSIPKEKLQTDAGLKEVIRDLGRQSGKRFTDQELNRYVAQFRSMYKNESVGSLLNKLSRQGFDAQELEKIKRRFK